MKRWKACEDCRYDGDCDEQKHPTHLGNPNIKRGECPCNGKEIWGEYWERDDVKVKDNTYQYIDDIVDWGIGGTIKLTYWAKGDPKPYVFTGSLKKWKEAMKENPDIFLLCLSLVSSPTFHFNNI